ncbi:hypothetical protein CTI12_AA553230 [Artemisia annua]|uniref:Arabinogalactan peptide, AGP n=1 Tax=Artemisia annua TaxID=35608 RepID=A0A2U1KXT9_ARTAN|nr:hypothetical protein CTI12_AA553230 [Artemisia annua]
MASNGVFRSAFIAFFILLISATAVFGRDIEYSMAPAPAPMDTGSASSTAISMVFVSAAFLLLSMTGVIFH